MIDVNLNSSADQRPPTVKIIVAPAVSGCSVPVGARQNNVFPSAEDR